MSCSNRYVPGISLFGFLPLSEVFLEEEPFRKHVPDGMGGPQVGRSTF